MSTATPWADGRLLSLQPRRPGVLFGRMYEDPGVDLAAFPPPGARVLCIASAGDTAAALAAAGHQVTAVDVNPAQLAYARARLTTGAPAATGAAERLLALGRAAAATALPAWRPAALERFLRLDDPAAQARHWHRHLDGPGLRLLLGVALRPAGALAGGLHPAFRAVLPRRFDTVLRARLARGFARHPNADNPWAWRLLLGRELPGAGRVGHELPGGGPPVRLLHGDVLEHLERSPAAAYDAVTLSNVLDGPDPAFARRLRAAVRHAVRPGGIAVLRSIREPGPAGPGAAAEDRCPLWGVVRVVRL
jgi:SAM-dependent methyltransferase